MDVVREWLSRYKRPSLLMGILLLILITGITFGIWRAHANKAAQLPTSIRKQVTSFTLYTPTPPLPDGFSLLPGAQYDRGVLSFIVANRAGQQITVTEQALPAVFKDVNPQGGTTVKGVKGVAVFVSLHGRLYGTFITKDRSALLSFTAPASVNSRSFQDIMRNLAPIQ